MPRTLWDTSHNLTKPQQSYSCSNTHGWVSFSPSLLLFYFLNLFLKENKPVPVYDVSVPSPRALGTLWSWPDTPELGLPWQEKEEPAVSRKWMWLLGTLRTWINPRRAESSVMLGPDSGKSKKNGQPDVGVHAKLQLTQPASSQGRTKEPGAGIITRESRWSITAWTQEFIKS